jgi:1-acyl-sn-glycerol-3-phosphate acyltransferase
MLEHWATARVGRALHLPSGVPTPRLATQPPPPGWLYQFGHRRGAELDHTRLRWYRDQTWTYRVTARAIVPAILRGWARVTVDGLENVPSSGPVILAANHRDNLDPYLLFVLLSRPVHVAARPDGFGTGALCALWRRLGAFPADAWGVRHAVSLLAHGGVVAMFPQAMTSRELGQAKGATGVVALRSGAPVVPVAITGTDTVHATRLLSGRARIAVRFGRPVRFVRAAGAPRSRVAADEILQLIGALLSEAAADLPT